MKCALITISEGIRNCIKEIGISDIQAELLFAHIIGCDREMLYTMSDTCIEDNIYKKIEELAKAVRKGYPIDYILGYKYFWNHKFYIDENVLIPRADTETLVEYVLDNQEFNIDNNSTKDVLEIGTGSGIISISLAKERQNWNIIAIDISIHALEIAKKNISNIDVKNVSLLQSDLFSNIPKDSRFDIIVSNPPYVASNDKHLLELQHEPVIALIGGDDGLEYIRKISSDSRNFIKRNGTLVLEHGYNQSIQVKEILESNGYSRIETKKDTLNHIRVTSGRF